MHLIKLRARTSPPHHRKNAARAKYCPPALCAFSYVRLTKCKNACDAKKCTFAPKKPKKQKRQQRCAKMQRCAQSYSYIIFFRLLASYFFRGCKLRKKYKRKKVTKKENYELFIFLFSYAFSYSYSYIYLIIIIIFARACYYYIGNFSRFSLKSYFFS